MPAITSESVHQSHTRQSDRAAGGPQLRPHTVDDDLRPGHHLRADPDDGPTGLFQQCDAVDVPGSLPPISPVLKAVLLDCDLPLPPSHVDADMQVTKLNLGLGGR